MTVIVVGAGINGVTAAIELKKRGHEAVLVDPGPLPHPLAASTDISKAVRAAYGADEDYSALAERSIELWHEWNHQFGIELYHESGHKFERINAAKLRERFPAFNAELYHDGFFDPQAGYVESGRVVATLLERAKSLGVELRERAKLLALDEGDDRVKGIVLDDRHRIAADAVVVAIGAWTPYVLPFTRKFFRATGHPVFHLKPHKPDLFSSEKFPFFGADISTTGYYGFPLNQGVIKIANHGLGREMSPGSVERAVTRQEEKDLREFLSDSLPALAHAPIVYTRICMYCDTHDGDFWIAPDPERPGLVIATGDCGHGFKFAPMLGEITADAVEMRANPLLQKFRWRPEVKAGATKEAARFRGKD